jgi:hypothetical protein
MLTCGAADTPLLSNKFEGTLHCTFSPASRLPSQSKGQIKLTVEKRPIRLLIRTVTLSYVNILVDGLLSVVGFFVFEHAVNDLDELPGEGVHSLPVAFAFLSLSPVILTGLGVDPDLRE